jgi:hypothetical protein
VKDTIQRSYRAINGSVTAEPRQGGEEEMVSQWTLPRAMIITLLCAVLLSMSPALAGAIGTSTTVKPVSPTTVIEVPRDSEGREGRETHGLSIPPFIIGVLVGGLLGLLGYRVLQGWRARQERQQDIDRLTEQFQALFRESDQGKNPSS